MAIVVAGTLGLAGCSGSSDSRAGTFYGPERALGSGTARTYVVLAADGNPSEIGLRFSRDALEGLSDRDSHADVSVGTGVFPKSERYELPAQAKSTAYDHVVVDWAPQGHAPTGTFDKPHFDLRFYLQDPEAVAAIDPTAADYVASAATLPEAKYLPPDYVPAGDPATETVPYTGLRWLDSTLPFNPQTFQFTQVLINGTWDGRYLFVEPMLTRDWLLTEPRFAGELKQAEAVQKSGYYASGYAVRFDDERQEYSVALTGLTARTAS